MAGVRLLPEEALAVQRYAQARRSLSSVNPVLLGFQMLGADDALLSAEEAGKRWCGNDRRLRKMCSSGDLVCGVVHPHVINMLSRGASVDSD